MPLERAVEHRIASFVVEVGENDSVLFGQRLPLMRTIVKSTCNQCGDQQDGNSNLPEVTLLN